MEISSISQCVFCGSYHLFVIGTVDLSKSGKHKVSKLKRDLHAAEEEAIEQLCLERGFRLVDGTRVVDVDNGEGTNKQDQQTGNSPPKQMRVPAAKSKAKGGSPNGGCGSKKGHWRFSMSPCGTCTEIYYGQSFEALQTEAWYLRESARMTPQVPVMFEFSSRDLQAIGDYLPAAYKRVGSRWQLRNGVGPESLELFKGSQWRLPAGQFKVLLPGGVVSSAPALSGTTKGGAGKGHSKGSDHTSNVGKSGGNKKPVGVSDIPIGEMAEFLRLFWEDDTGLNEKEVVELGSVTEDGALYVNKPILSCVEYRDALLRKLDSGTT